MKLIYLLIATIIFGCNTPELDQCTNIVSCYNTSTHEEVIRCGPCDSELNWEPIEAPNFKTGVGNWAIYQCGDLHSYDGTGDEKSVTLGLNGYDSPCLFESTPIDVTKYPLGTLLKVTVLQEGGASSSPELPYYTHFFARFGEGPVDLTELYYLPLKVEGEYEASCEFPIPLGATTFNPVLGINPTLFIGSQDLAEQPTARLMRVKIEVHRQ